MTENNGGSQVADQRKTDRGRRQAHGGIEEIRMAATGEYCAETMVFGQQ